MQPSNSSARQSQRSHSASPLPAATENVPAKLGFLQRLGRWLQSLKRDITERWSRIEFPSFASMRSRTVSVLPVQQSKTEQPPTLPTQRLMVSQAGSAPAVRAAEDPQARRQRSQQAAADFKRELEQACPANADIGAFESRLQRLDVLKARLPALQDLDDADRTACAKLVDDRRSLIEPSKDDLKNRLTAVKGDLEKAKTWSGVKAALPVLQERLAVLQKALPLCRALKDEDRQALGSGVQALQSRVTLVETRDTDLAALKVEAPRMGRMLSKLPPQAYLPARGGLLAILQRLPETPRTLLMAHLDGKITHADQARWLHDLAQGDAVVIDTLFKGADWHDDALALKMATLDPGNAQALRNLDVQHNLRMVADDLDAFMASRNAAGKAHLPVSLFGAVQADETVINWLVKYASEEVSTRSAQIGAWISLSLYDPALGKVDEAKVNGLLAKLQKQGMDAGLLRAHIRQGFRNAAEVVECRELMQSVARACQESTLLASLDETRFHALHASRVVRDLFREVTGRKTEIATGPEVDQALADVVDETMPWIRFEQDLVHSRAELKEALDQLTLVSYKLPGHDKADRSWLGDPAQLAAAGKDHDMVRDILYADSRLQELKVEGGDPARIKELADAIAQKCKALAGFNPANLRRDKGSRALPNVSQLREIALEMNRLVRLPVLHSRVATLRELSQPSAEQGKQAAQLMDRLQRIAILQVGLESGDPEFSPSATPSGGTGGYTGRIVKRLAAFGISSQRSSAFLKHEVQDAARALGKDKRSMGKLVSDFDPEGSLAKLRGMFQRVTGAKRGSLSAGGATADPAPVAVSVTEGQRHQALALASVERQVQELALGQAFDIRMGVYGTVSVGSPVVPGVNTSTDLRAERQNGIRVTLQPDGGYVVRVQGGGAVRHGVSLSALSELVNFRGESQVAREKGFELRFGDRESCLSMLRGLITGGEMDPAVWAPVQVQRIERQSLDGRASLSVKADLTLAALSVEAAAALGSESTFKTSATGEVETQIRRAKVGVTAGAQALTGGASRESSTGLNLSAGKTLRRQYGMLRPGSEATLTSTVVGGNATRCLDSLFPADAGVSDAQRQAFLDSLPSESGKVPDGTELFVRYRLTPAAIREANALLGQASSALTRAALASGAARQAARDEAGGLARQAHEVTRRADSYTLDGWGWTRREQAEVSRHRGVYQQFARGESETTQFTAADMVADTVAGAPSLSPTLARLLP